MEGPNASFVADAIAVMESLASIPFLSKELDDEALVFSFSPRKGVFFAVLGNSYPQETVVLGNEQELTFRGLALSNIVAQLCASPQQPVAKSQFDKDCDQIMGAKYGQLGDMKREPNGISFKFRGKRISVTASVEYPRNSVVSMPGDMSIINVPLPAYLEKLDSKETAVKKMKSDESEGSGENDADDGDDDNDDEDDERGLQSSGECLSEDLAHFSVAAHCGPLLRDKEAVAERWDDDAVYVINQVDDSVNLALHLYPTFLSARVATAWGIVQGLPIRIALKDLSASMYCNGPPPSSVQICQMIDGTAARHGVLPQLEFIAQNFIKEEWQKFKARGGVYYQDLENVSSRSGSTSDNIAILKAMGFGRKQAEEALAKSKGDIEGAVAYSLFKKGKAVAAAPHQSITHSVEEAERKKRSFVVDGYHGLLVALMEYLTFRLASLNEFCPLCDCGHMFGAPMLKPAVCRRELCAFAFSKLGLMSETVDGVAMQAEVVDLLVSMCRAAAQSGRASAVLDPCPLIFDPKNPEQPVISDVAKDLHLINQALSGIKMSTMMEVSRNKANVHPLSFPMLHWVVSSNRSHLVKLGTEKHLACMGTKHQYLLLSAPPEVEEAFAARKKKSGTVWAFHGSRTENWHAILRNGVKNMSGTKGQLNGAAFGPGVYVSPTASLSLGYSGIRAQAPGTIREEEREFLEGEFSCMAIVEIIAGAEKRHNGSVWTIVDDTMVCTRFFIVFPPGASITAASSAVSTSEEFIRQVESAMIGLE